MSTTSKHRRRTANTNSNPTYLQVALRPYRRGEPEYAAAYLIHSREKLMFSHPDRINGIKRAPRVTAEGFSRVTESDAKR